MGIPAPAAYRCPTHTISFHLLAAWRGHVCYLHLTKQSKLRAVEQLLIFTQLTRGTFERRTVFFPQLRAASKEMEVLCHKTQESWLQVIPLPG